MQKKTNLSRRTVMATLAAAPLAPTTTFQGVTRDARLMALGDEFDKLAGEWDMAFDPTLPFDKELFEKFGRVEAEIVSTEAKTIEGFYVKARAACWCRLGDVDPPNDTTTDVRMALSIVRDLIRLCDPAHERPNALRDLVGHVEQDASKA